MGVSLGDLRLSIPPGKSYNLLDSKHFNYTLEQLEASASCGSLKAKSDKIKRRPPPNLFKKPERTIEFATDLLITRRKSLVIAEEFRLDELPSLHDDQMMSDTKFAEEMVKDEEDSK